MSRLGRVCSMLAALMIAAVMIAVIPLVLPKVFGFQIFGVLSDSMEPQITAGSVVYVKPGEPEDVQAGDIITFKSGGDSKSVVTHRVLEIAGGKRIFRTKGDKNDSLDAEPVSFDRYIGKVSFSVPQIGNFAKFVQSAGGVAAGVVLLAGACILWTASDFIKKKQRSKEEP